MAFVRQDRCSGQGRVIWRIPWHGSPGSCRTWSVRRWSWPRKGDMKVTLTWKPWILPYLVWTALVLAKEGWYEGYLDMEALDPAVLGLYCDGLGQGRVIWWLPWHGSPGSCRTWSGRRWSWSRKGDMKVTLTWKPWILPYLVWTALVLAKEGW